MASRTLARIAKTDFAFRRMNVHIYFTRIEIDEEKSDRKLSAHQRGMISFAQCCSDDAAFDGSAVHEDELLRARLAG